MSDLKTINLKDEKYKDFLIRMEKVRGESEYNVDIIDRRIGKKTVFMGYGKDSAVHAKSKADLIEKLRPILDKMMGHSVKWDVRKKYLEQKYNIQNLTRKNGQGRYDSFIYFYKDIKWEVKIERSSLITIEYEEYPYDGKKYSGIDYDERSRCQAYAKFRFNASLEKQIIESIKRISKYKDVYAKMGTFGVDVNKINTNISEGERNEDYRGFQIKLKYMYNSLENEMTITTFVYKNNKLLTTDSKQVSIYSPDRYEEEFKYAFRQAKDYIASKIIYNTDKYKAGDYDMQNPEDKYHDVRHFGKKTYSDISTKAKHKQWKKSAEESVRGW